MTIEKDEVRIQLPVSKTPPTDGQNATREGANVDLSEYPHRILVCVTGLTPQILTETLYALAVQRQPAFVPTEIHVLTTAEGALRADLMLLDAGQGQFYRLCADYGLDAEAIAFASDSLHIIPDRSGRSLDDIRSLEDNEAAADAITALVRRLTRDPDSVVHASIAGGRKTMGFYLGYALSLFGRPQDRLSHVLVTTDLESHPQFFFPPLKPQVLFNRDNRPVRTDQAQIVLADIPFVRLRNGLPEYLLEGRASYSATVHEAQRRLGPPELVVDYQRRRISCAGVVIAMPPVEFAFVAWLAQRVQQDRPGICRSLISTAETAEFLQEYQAVTDRLSGDLERVEAALKKGMDVAYFDDRKTTVHKLLNQRLGKAAEPYHIRSVGRCPGTRYNLYAFTLRPDQIRVGDLAEEA